MPTYGLNEYVVVLVQMKSPIRLGVRANKKARNVSGKMVKYLQSLLLAAWLPPFSETIRPCSNLFPSFKETLSQYYSSCEEK